MPKACVLMSGGMDSTTCFHIAGSEFGYDNLMAVSVNYGQRHSKELEHAKRSCSAFDVPHHVLDLSSVIGRTMLTDPDQPVPDKSYSEIEGESPTYVPYRNGLMLSAATSFFHNFLRTNRYDTHDGEYALYFGAHAEDAHAWAYADCTPEFIGALANAIWVGTYGEVRLRTPLQWLDKAGVVLKGNSLGVNWNDTWSCYKGGDRHCGTCPTCRSRKGAFTSLGIPDPTLYDG